MSKRICSYCFLFLLVLTTLLNPHRAEAGRTVRVGVYEAGSLANFDKDGSAHGFFVDILNRIAEKELWNVQYVPGSWQEGLDRLKSDNIDLVLCIGYTAEREKYMDFPKEYLLLNWGVLYRPKGSQITSLLQLEGKSVSALKGDVYLTGFKELLRQFNVNVKIEEVDQYSKVFKAVESGAVAAGIAGNLYGILNENGRRAEQTPVIFAPIKVGYAVNEGKNGDLIEALDRNIAEMKADKASIYKRELERLLGNKEHFIPKELYWALSGVFAALLLAIAFIVLLKRQVKSKTSHLVIEIDERKKAEEALLALKEELQEQNEELQLNEEELQTQNNHLLATEEMLRVQINEFASSQKLLQESASQFRTLFEESPVAIWEEDFSDVKSRFDELCNSGVNDFGAYFDKNPDELANLAALVRICKVNQRSLELIGVETSEQFVRELPRYFTPDSYQVFKEEMIALAEGKRIFQAEIPVLDNMGKHHLLELHLTVPHEHIQTLSRVFISFLDITERKQAEAERQQLEHQFHQAQKLESLGVLAGGIAHDFNNILTVIMGHCYMAQNDMIPEQEYKAAFQKMETAGNRAKDLCRQMLTYAGKSQMEQTQVNLWLLVDEVVKMLQAAIRKNVTFKLDLKRDVPEINGDSAQIQQIVMNLIINSADAIGDKNGTISVILTKTVFETDQTENDTFRTVIKAGRYACLEVTDTGCGMDEATQKRIFEPFFTTKFTGRGLGMSAIHGIIKSHEAILQLTSKPGVGTTFKVYFPVPQPSDYAKTNSTTTVPLEEASGTVLMVEDEELLRIMGKELLDAHGFTAMTASNGSEALEIYRERGSEIDVILLDLIMPVMGGIETYHELRKINPTVSIIICSGYAVESVEHVINNDPHAGFVHKPYKPDELRDVLVRMMNGKRSRR